MMLQVQRLVFLAGLIWFAVYSIVGLIPQATFLPVTFQAICFQKLLSELLDEPSLYL